jgi:hypothetical protein
MNYNCTLREVPRYYIIVSQPPWSKVLLDKLMAAQPAVLWILKFHRLVYISTPTEPVLRQIQSKPLTASLRFLLIYPSLHMLASQVVVFLQTFLTSYKIYQCVLHVQPI